MPTTRTDREGQRPRGLCEQCAAKVGRRATIEERKLADMGADELVEILVGFELNDEQRDQTRLSVARLLRLMRWTRLEAMGDDEAASAAWTVARLLSDQLVRLDFTAQQVELLAAPYGAWCFCDEANGSVHASHPALESG
ncbi:MAG: hypothetical protein WD556_07790 [Actinomycetota bacterium]